MFFERVFIFFFKNGIEKLILIYIKAKTSSSSGEDWEIVVVDYFLYLYFYGVEKTAFHFKATIFRKVEIFLLNKFAVI